MSEKKIHFSSIVNLILKIRIKFRTIFVWLKIGKISFLKNILFIYFYREEKGRRKGGRETLMCACLLHVPYWGPGPQHRHAP